MPKPFQLVPTRTPAVKTISGVGLFLRTWLSNYSPATKKAYVTAFEDFAAFTGAPSVEAAVLALFRCQRQEAAAVLAAWRTDLSETRKRSPATCNNRMAAMRSMLSEARELDLIDWRVRIKDFHVVPYRDTRGPGLPAVRKMLAEADKARWVDLRRRNVAIVRLLFDLGLRGSEVVSLDFQDVDLPGKRLWVLGKGRTQREPMTLPRETAAALAGWIKYRGELPGPLFTILSHNKTGGRICRQTVFRLVRDLGQAVGVKTSPHPIRHTSITVVAVSCSLLDAQRFARHANPMTTMRYVDTAKDIAGKAARKLAARLQPPKSKGHNGDSDEAKEETLGAAYTPPAGSDDRPVKMNGHDLNTFAEGETIDVEDTATDSGKEDTQDEGARGGPAPGLGDAPRSQRAIGRRARPGGRPTRPR